MYGEKETLWRWVQILFTTLSFEDLLLKIHLTFKDYTERPRYRPNVH